MPTVTGTIDKLYVNKVNSRFSKDGSGKVDTYKYSINGQYYSGGFKKWPINEGDEVEIVYEVNAKGYNDIKSASMIVAGPISLGHAAAPTPAVSKPAAKSIGRTFPVDLLAPERTINRQNALTNAVSFAISDPNFDYNPDTVIEVARTFEAYTCGDIDREEAMAMAAEEK